MNSYFRGRWPEDPVPKGEPHSTYYEVDVDRDVVTRLIEQFADGSLFRDSIELAQREGPDLRDPENRSLVHGSFLELTDGQLEVIHSDEFAVLWSNATDRPWPPDVDVP